MSTKPYDIEERCTEFTTDVTRFIYKCQNEKSKLPYPLYDQLFRAAGSIGANIIESSGGNNTKKEFIRFHSIALRSAKETKYWLTVVNNVLANDNLKNISSTLLKESDELIKITAAIIRSSKKAKEPCNA